MVRRVSNFYMRYRIFTYTINVLTQVIVTFRSAPVCSHISYHQSTSTTCTHEIIDCGNAFALGPWLGWSFEARMGMPTRQNVTVSAKTGHVRTC